MSKLVVVSYEQHSEQHVPDPAGESDVPVAFTVERTRDGKSFLTRTVKVLQRNKTIFVALVSFHMQESGLEVRASTLQLALIRSVSLHPVESVGLNCRDTCLTLCFHASTLTGPNTSA